MSNKKQLDGKLLTYIFSRAINLAKDSPIIKYKHGSRNFRILDEPSIKRASWFAQATIECLKINDMLPEDVEIIDEINIKRCRHSLDPSKKVPHCKDCGVKLRVFLVEATKD